MRWGVALCSCNQTLGWEPRAIQRALGLPESPALFHRLLRDEVHRFMEWAAAGRFDGVAVACCGAAGLFREAAAAAGLGARPLAVLNPREGCFWPHPERTAANDKAARLLRAAMAEAGPAPPRPALAVRAGARVLIAADSAAGLELARRLGEHAEPTLLLDERSAAFDPSWLHPLPWPASWGTVARVEGSLGQFRVTVERRQPIDLRTCIHCRKCIPICHTQAISEGLRLRLERCDRCGDCLTACAPVGAIRIPREEHEVLAADQVVLLGAAAGPAGPGRTGCHRLAQPTAAELDALAWKVRELVGEFQRPQYVRYDADTCAGGAAGQPACGRCIPACPYDAIARDPGNPLRVRVDLPACEGCGACVAACPTSSLSFTEPPPAELARRLRRLLAPLGDGRPAAAPVVVFHCPEEGAAALDEAGRRRLAYPARALPVPMACLRQVSEGDVLQAFRLGAGAVALVGCEDCPHGERELLRERLETVRAILGAFGVPAPRVALLTGAAAAVAEGLGALADAAPAPVVAWDGTGPEPRGEQREAVAEALRALLAATGRRPGPTPVPARAPFATPQVRAEGCTLCRTCVNVCPTHAFRFREAAPTLELRAVACVDCGLCAAACPEGVITLASEVSLAPEALEYRPVVRDEVLGCTSCGAPFGTRRAVELIERKLAGMAALAETFAGSRRRLLRMCPRCRAAAAVLEMQKGWEP
jgi:ferredoxin